MAEIVLKTGEVALVDPLWWSYLSRFRWSLLKTTRCSSAYAISSINGRTALMHRVILGAPKGLYVDHIDNDGLNNQAQNLRLCTNRQNQGNRRPNKNGSGIKGVSRCTKCKNRWVAQIYDHGKRIFVGRFSTPESAGRAYDEAAVEIFGDFARLNFPDEKAG